MGQCTTITWWWRDSPWWNPVRMEYWIVRLSVYRSIQVSWIPSPHWWYQRKPTTNSCVWTRYRMWPHRWWHKIVAPLGKLLEIVRWGWWISRRSSTTPSHPSSYNLRVWGSRCGDTYPPACSPTSWCSRITSSRRRLYPPQRTTWWNWSLPPQWCSRWSRSNSWRCRIENPHTQISHKLCPSRYRSWRTY